MSTAFDNLLKADAAALLAVAGEFAEPITYRPRVGADRPIYASIVREVPTTPEEFSEGKVHVIEVTVQNNSTAGVALTELVNGDKFVLPVTQGATAAEFPIPLAPAFQDAATLTFRLGRQ